jgi:DNA gyrase inhibitor GyrI
VYIVLVDTKEGAPANLRKKENEMSETKVRIVKLEKIHVASVLGFGKEPEAQAWAKLITWAKPKGYLEDLANHRIFGFNNPSPSPGSPNYGYELWMIVDEQEEPEGEVEIKDFPGGLYAVGRCAVNSDLDQDIGAAWHKLVLWREDSRYQGASHQWLEEHVKPEGKGVVGGAGFEWDLDLYLPIAE